MPLVIKVFSLLSMNVSHRWSSNDNILAKDFLYLVHFGSFAIDLCVSSNFLQGDHDPLAQAIGTEKNMTWHKKKNVCAGFFW